MLFIHPIILLALPLVFLPIIIHLLNRLRYRSVAWAAITFIMKATRSSTNMARIRQWLILLLRTLAVLLLILALSRPILSGWLGWKLAGTPERIIILLDRSASMGITFNREQNVLEHALAMIEESGKKNAPNSEILLIDSLNMRVISVPSWNILEKIPQTEITQASADFPLMFRLAVDYLLKNPSGLTEIWCVSDMQKSNWKPGESEWLENDEKLKALSIPVICKVLKIQSVEKNNRSINLKKIISYSTENKRKITELVLEINRIAGESELEIPLSISINKIAQQKSIKLSGKKSIIRIPLPDSNNKISIASLNLPDDANLYDNNCFIAYGELLNAKIVIVSDNQHISQLLSAATLPEDNDEKKIIQLASFSELNDSNLNDSALLLSDLPYPNDINKQKIIEKFLNSGGCAVFFASNHNSDNHGLYTFGKLKEYPQNKPVSVISWEHKDGPLADAISGTELPLTQLKIFKLKTLSKGNIKPYAVLSDGRPFLYRRLFSKGGALYFCSVSLLSSWSNLSEGPVLVPMLARLRKTASQRFSKIFFRDCGKWTYNLKSKPPNALLPGINGNLYTPSSGMAGIYLDKGIYNILNRPVAENDQTRMNKSQIDSLLKTKKLYLFTEKAGQDSSLQTEIWRYMLIFMFCFLMAESFILAPRKEKE